MTTVVAVFGALIALLGATGMAKPATLLDWVTSVWRSRRGVYLAVALRLIFGVALIAAAPHCRFPQVVRILGVVSLVAASIVPIVGFERLRSVIDWWASRSRAFLRVWCLAAMAFGAFLVYAAI